MRHGASNPRAGFALLVVLLVLVALLVLAAPFLMMARNADRASTELQDRVRARLALDAASRHARVELGPSFPGADRTPYYDSLEEVRADNRFDPAFFDANDPRGLSLDLEARDVAGEIDLNSAPPQVFANLMGLSTRLSRAIQNEEKEVPLASVAGLEPAGVVWIRGELLRYTKLAEGALERPVRGVLGPPNPSEWRGGPLPPSAHDAGAPAIDQRAFAPALWRVASGTGEVRTFDSKERVRECGGFVMAAAEAQPAAPEDAQAAARRALSEDALQPLFLHGSVHGGVRGGSLWQRAARLAAPVQGGRDGILRVDNARWFNAGTTVQVTDGASTELALVQEVRRGGEIVLDRILEGDYREYDALVRVLARRPVNVNTASAEVLRALFLNLQVAGRNSRITGDEADKLATLVLESRPFEGFEDFLLRVVLPAAGIEKLPADAPVFPEILAAAGSGLAAGAGFIDPDDALALAMNGLNANDGGLLYSTMPFSFVTRDTYDLELRASVAAPSGVERFALVREETGVVVPQRQLLALWTRQEDFDESLRLDLEAPWWMTGPNATSRFDSGSVPPSRLWAHLGTAEGRVFLPGVTDMSAFKDRSSLPTAEHVFPSREDSAWIQLWPSRVDGEPNQQGRVMHFDHETRDPEGRYLPDEVVSSTTDDAQVGWTSAKSLLIRPFSFSLWVKPRALADATLVDVGGTSHESDRGSLLLVDGTDLVFRLIAGGGDHPGTAGFEEVTELRFALAAGPGPGLPLNVWSHVEVDARGTRPDQIQMLVNGLTSGVRAFGLTRLSGGLAVGSPEVPVESVEGFPATSPVSAGSELIEATVDAGGMTSNRTEAGKLAGYGGRFAREPFETLHHALTPGDVPVNLQALLSNPQQAGTNVGLAGYSLPLETVLPVGNSELDEDLLPFRAARLAGVEGGETPAGDNVEIAGIDPRFPDHLGFGLEGSTSGATGLVLVSADSTNDTSGPNPIPPADFMAAFDPDGGYAAILTAIWDFGGSPGEDETAGGSRIGGIEVIRYSGWTNTTLQIAARGDQLPELENLRGLTGDQARFMGGRRAFVATWDTDQMYTDGRELHPIAPDLRLQTYVIPISLQVPGATGLEQYPAARKGNSAFVQLTRIDDAEFTEWVRYDWFATSFAHLVRDDPAALLNALRAIVDSQAPGRLDRDDGGGGGGGGGGAMNAFLSAPRTPAPAAPAIQAAPSAVWDPRIGKSENDAFPLSEAIETAFQFRGVFGTYSHRQAAGTKILPVFQTAPGKPGRLDAAFLVGANPDHVGWPVTVHRSHFPALRIGTTRWTQPDPETPSAPVRASGETLVDQDAFLLERTFVALQEATPQPFSPDPAPAATDPRLRTRLVCPPSGELPRIVGRVAVGGGFDGAQGGAIPAATVDEIVFGDAQFGRKSPGDPDAIAGQSLIVSNELSDQSTDLVVVPKALQLASGPIALDHEFLTELPSDAGLLKLGDEIVAYSARDPQSGQITLAANGGRGLLGTRPQPHHAGEFATFLESHPVGVLAASLSATDSALQLVSVEDFPTEGTVLVDDELIHYTRIRENLLEMPRASTVAGKTDGKGGGLFRGRYGTTPAAHTQGTVVILFPFRYWDRWQARADAPELAYFTLSVDQPSAWWDSFFFDTEDADSARIGVLARFDPEAPWDGEPDEDPRLRLLWRGDAEGKAIPIGRQSDRVDWRVFVKYDGGAFDPATGLAHGWKQTPTLKRLAAFYFAPPTVLSSVER